MFYQAGNPAMHPTITPLLLLQICAPPMSSVPTSVSYYNFFFQAYRPSRRLELGSRGRKIVGE